MPGPSKQLEQRVPALLGELLGEGSPATPRAGGAPRGDGPPLLVLEVGPRTFFVHCKGSGDAGPMALAIRELLDAPEVRAREVVPVVAVPYMGPVGKRLCHESGVSWLDLSGNAYLVAPDLRVQIEGRPNQFKRRGRPANVFAPKSSRVTRHLLLHPETSFLQRELAEQTGLAETYVSRVVRRLEEEGFLLRDDHGAVSSRSPDLLLDAWAERYDFRKHDIMKGHVSARSSLELLAEFARELDSRSVPYAATALPSAWLRNQFARFRIVTLYLEAEPSAELLDSLHFEEGPRGANVWLVVPNDEGVFHGAEVLDHDVRSVSAVQTYLDLQGHPERSREAAERLRETCLRWEGP